MSPQIAGAATAVDRTARALGNTLDFVGGTIESFFAPQLTAEQKREAEITAREQRADTEECLETSRRLADRDLAIRRQEEERDAAKQRQRDHRER